MDGHPVFRKPKRPLRSGYLRTIEMSSQFGRVTPVRPFYCNEASTVIRMARYPVLLSLSTVLEL